VPDFKILVVDDEYGRPGLDRDNFLACVKREESDFVFTTGQNEDGRNVPEVTLDLIEELWERSGPSRLSLVLLDVRFPDRQDSHDNLFGFKLLRALRNRFGRALPIVMLTAETEVRGSANEAGADGFLPKDHLAKERLDQQYLWNGVFPDPTGRLLGSARAFLLTLRELRRVVKIGAMELLLLGEVGVGKTQLAEYVHAISGRPRELLKKWSAHGLSPDTHWYLLFGNWKGAFTDGPKEHLPGVAETAHGGTLFIDEIAELNPIVQPILLEYAERSRRDNLRRIKRMGIAPKNSAINLNIVGRYSTEEERVLVDTLLITATNKPLYDPTWLSEAGFRTDLLSRLGHRIMVPPLRERAEDIVPLFLFFFKGFAQRDIIVTPDTRRLLEAHEWREANLRGLQTFAERVSTRVAPEFDELHPHHFEDLLQQRPTREATAATARLVDIEVQSLWGAAERLRSAVLETSRAGRAGTLSDILRYATGVDYSATDVKREVKDMLSGWFAPNDRKAARWSADPNYQKLAERVRADAVLLGLYRYATDEISWNEARELMAPVFGDEISAHD
jgi:DNA-binding NtrC family response regulator